MKKLFIFGIVALLASCNTQRRTTTGNTHQESSILKTELSFNNCDSVVAFLKTMIINNNSDTSLRAGDFRIPFINSSYENTRSLFPEKCFVGMPADDLISIFGKWDYSGTSTHHPAWYVLKYPYGTKLVFEVWIKDRVVEKFKVVPSSDDSTNPSNKKR
ncbi:MAG: hypothetical protein SH848_07455 [Saprospiraceae bacterium]|nr:hypothetical protein [Saprospiraceae bacterium]MDZ4703749.1 hypothetical protein [Saprospiraceae bacterium]